MYSVVHKHLSQESKFKQLTKPMRIISRPVDTHAGTKSNPEASTEKGQTPQEGEERHS